MTFKPTRPQAHAICNLVFSGGDYYHEPKPALPKPPEPPAKYESAGTWFDPHAVAARAIRSKMAPLLRASPDFHYPSKGGSSYHSATGRTFVRDDQARPIVDIKTTTVRERFAARLKEPTMPKATIQSQNSSTFVTTTDLSELKITTPAGHEIGGASAGYAFDHLNALARDFCPDAKRGNGEVTGMGQTLRQAIESDRAARTAQRNNAARYLAERDEARAQVESLKRELRAVGAQCEEARPAPAVTPNMTLAHIASACRAAAREVLPLGIAVSTRHEKSAEVQMGEVQIVIRERDYSAPPAVTPDTVVTLGMLRELTIAGDDLRLSTRVVRGYRLDRSVLGQVLDTKLGHK